MAKYPVNIVGSVTRYDGSDLRKEAKNREEIRIAKVIEDYLNHKSESSEFPRECLPYFAIANTLRLSVKAVSDILFRYDGGTYSITIEKS